MVYGQLEYLKSTERMPPEIDPTISPTDDPDNSSNLALNNLYPAVTECFVIILCGYIAGRGNLISQTEAKGINIFVGTFSLPALIFMSMAQLDFSSVNWIFLASILLSKGLVFVIVVVVTLLIYRPLDASKAGMFGIFCTQSNDFALGYPIISALYNKIHPEYASYLYLIAPISFVILNPIGFVLMEIGKRLNLSVEEQQSSESENRCRMVPNIIRDIILTPVVFMTALGILGNFIFAHQLPIFLVGILEVFGKAFSATALFVLGLRMVGKVQDLRGSALVVPGILIAVKTIILPLVTREVVTLMKPGSNLNETSDFSNFGFLYGTFPTAPGVFVYSSQYNIVPDLIASAMVACTFLSAPLMFVTAKMVTLVKINPMDYVKELETFLLNVSIIGIICTVWVIVVFLLSCKWRKVPHFMTLCLAFSQCVACIGAIIWSVVECNHTWMLYLQFFFFAWGVFSSRIWTALLAITLFLLKWRDLDFVLKVRPLFCIIGWGIPGIIVTVLMLVIHQESELADKHDPNFQYGTTQAIVALLLLWFSLFTTLVCLILHQRYGKRYETYRSLSHIDPNDESHHPLTSSPSLSERQSHCILAYDNTSIESGSIDCALETNSTDNESIFSHDDHLSNQGSVSAVSFSTLTTPEENIIVRDRDDEFQIMRHVVLLLFLSGSMIVGFALCTWTLVTEEVTGVYVELVFLDVVLNFGQGLFTAVIFGLDTKLIVIPFMRWWRRLRHGANTLTLPSEESIDTSTRQVCDQFTNYHMDKCINDIVRDRRWRLKHLSAVFGGNELVDWLIMVGLAQDRTEAVKYGRKLVIGRIIRHIDNIHHFYDQPFFYTFKTNIEGD